MVEIPEVNYISARAGKLTLFYPFLLNSISNIQTILSIFQTTSGYGFFVIPKPSAHTLCFPGGLFFNVTGSNSNILKRQKAINA